MSLEFVPGRVQAGDYLFDIGTAGATSLVLQTVYLPLAFAGDESSVTIVGGTHVPFSPCFHYLERNWRCFLEAAGLELSLKLERAGFYPPGGGIVHARIPAVTGLRALHRTERGRLLQIRGSSAVANLTISIAERQRDRAVRRLSRRYNCCDIELEFLEAYSPGTILLLVAEFERSQACFFSLGQRGKRAEQVADETVDALLEFLDSEGAGDAYLADQLLLPLAFAKGKSLLRTSKVTGHMLTNAYIIGRFLPIEIGIQAEDKKSALVHISPLA